MIACLEVSKQCIFALRFENQSKKARKQNNISLPTQR